MAKRNDWERERDRERGRWDWDRNRSFGEHGRYESDREPGREYYWHNPRGAESGQGGESGRGSQWDESRHSSPERGDYSTHGDWGRQGSWGAYGNRAEFDRDYEWRRGQGGGEWGQRNREEWNQRTGPEWEPVRRESYGRFGAPGRLGGYGGGMGSYGGGIDTSSQSGQFSGRGPKGWQRSDERIKDDVSERLTDHPDIDASEIEVQVTGAEVTLTGTVDHRQAKRLAEDIAESVSGVKDVHNQIRVEKPYMREESVMTGPGTMSRNR